MANNTKCPVCSTTLSPHRPVTGEGPLQPGDISICVNCATYLEFDDDAMPIKMRETTRDKLAGTMELQSLAFAAEFIKQRNARM